MVQARDSRLLASTSSTVSIARLPAGFADGFAAGFAVVSAAGSAARSAAGFAGRVAAGSAAARLRDTYCCPIALFHFAYRVSACPANSPSPRAYVDLENLGLDSES